MEPPNQKFNDSFLQYAVMTSFFAALATGYFTWSFKRMVIVYGVGVLITMIIVVPDWDFFTKRNFTEWIEPMALDEESKKLQKARFPILKKTAKYAKREDIHPLGILFFMGTSITFLYYTWKFVTS